MSQIFLSLHVSEVFLASRYIIFYKVETEEVLVLLAKGNDLDNIVQICFFT
jgi:hypothetical protein